MDQLPILQTLLMADTLRRRALEAVAALDLPDCWIGAGFVRDAVWDHLHGYEISPPLGDVDVVWYSDTSPFADVDRCIEQQLKSVLPNLLWSVKNQARMHLRNADKPYQSVADAMKYWPETATAIGARIGQSGSIDINAPLGLDDLWTLQLRPTANFREGKLPIFVERVSSKNWIKKYPRLALDAAAIRPA